MMPSLTKNNGKNKSASAAILDELSDTIAARRHASPDSSWTAQLLSKGVPAVSQKLGEEAIETIIAAQQSPQRLVEESADLLYHLLVLWQAAGVNRDDVWRCLASRIGTSGIEEKKKRP